MKGYFASVPLASFMDQVSLVETVRHRLSSKNLGLQLPGSKCQQGPDDLRSLNWKLLSGRQCLEIVLDYTTLLTAGEECCVYASTGIVYSDMFPLSIRAMCEAYRRLFPPGRMLMRSMLGIYYMDLDDAAAFIRDARVKHAMCCAGDNLTKARVHFFRGSPSWVNR